MMQRVDIYMYIMDQVHVRVAKSALNIMCNVCARVIFTQYGESVRQASECSGGGAWGVVE